jgi:hypothetical protein
MHKDNIVIVVIPVYNENPKKEERRAFRNNIQILRQHPICIVTHKECDISVYNRIAKEEGIVLLYNHFDKSYFSSTESYNALCLSTGFYERFSNYKYMLICQLDVWIFRDEVIEWCSKGYDYIGAPIYYPYNESRYTKIFRAIGNGGLCLRRIKYCLEIVSSDPHKLLLKPTALFKMYWNLFLYDETYKSSWIKRFSIFPILIAKIFGFRNSFHYFASCHLNEDLLLGTWAEQSWQHTANLPDEITAAHFSIEVNADMLLKRMNGKCPMGVHAYEKWNNPLVPKI